MSKKKIKTKTNRSFYSILLCLIIGLGFIIFNDLGLYQLFHLYQKERQLYAEVNTLLTQQDTLQAEIYRLKTDQVYIQKIAREKFMMVLPGEKVYRVQDQKLITND